ncbi:hypothetical protein PFISCL1PPCAC_19255, partial [Pristionchus fissidentatus]
LVNLVDGLVQLSVGEVIGDLFEKRLESRPRDVSVTLREYESERLPQFLLERVLVDGVGDSVHQGAEFVEFEFSRAVGVEFTDQLTESLQIEVLLHTVHDLADLRGHDVALLSSVESIEELLVFLDLGSVDLGKNLFDVLGHFVCRECSRLERSED